MRRVWILGGLIFGWWLLIGCDARAIEIQKENSRNIRSQLLSYGANSGSEGRIVRVSSDGAAAITPEAKAEADSIFDDRCTACHGSDGDGKGPASATLKPGPKDFRNAGWQKATTDAQITKAIVSGGEAVGLSAGMPGNPDLEEKPAVVAALVVHIRSFGK
jgi:mono/diheme cytochrome c family protein